MSGSQIAPEVLDEIRARLTLSEIVGQRVALKRQGRNEFAGLCPFHNEKTPSFTVNDAKRFFHCFGCGAHGDVVGFAMRVDGLPFRQAVQDLGRRAGIDPRLLGESVPLDPAEARAIAERQAQLRARAEAWQAERARIEARQRERDRALALQWWREAQPADGSVVETYLRSRSIDPARLPVFTAAPNSPSAGYQVAGLPATLRHHKGLLHWESGRTLDAMVAPIVDSEGRLIGLHRTFLRGDGRDKADVTPAKKVQGETRGGSIHLTPCAAHLKAAEGIETTLHVMQLEADRPEVKAGAIGYFALVTLGNFGGGGDHAAQARAPWHPTRAQPLNRAGDPILYGKGIRLPTTVPDMDRPGFVPPPMVRRITMLEDRDNRDPESAEAIYQRAANRWCRLGLQVERAPAPEGHDYDSAVRSDPRRGAAHQPAAPGNEEARAG